MGLGPWRGKAWELRLSYWQGDGVEPVCPGLGGGSRTEKGMEFGTTEESGIVGG